MATLTTHWYLEYVPDYFQYSIAFHEIKSTPRITFCISLLLTDKQQAKKAETSDFATGAALW